MGLSNPVGQFGVHSVCIYNRTTRVPISYLRVLKETTLDFTAEWEDLMGGSQLYLYDTEIKSINSEINLTVAEYPASAMEIFLGGVLTENAAEASGAVDEYDNVNGTSIKSAANGIDAIELTSADSGDIKTGTYILKATAAQVVSLYGTTDVDFLNGTDLSFSNDTLLIESGIDCSSTDVVIEELGITISIVGTPAFAVDDTAYFTLRKVNTGSIELVFGQAAPTFDDFGMIIVGQKQSGGTISYMDLYRVKGAGMPISFNEKAWSEWSLTLKALYDSTKDAIGKFYRIEV